MGAHGVNVNAVAPGYIETDNTQALRDDPERVAQILERIPGRTLGHAGRCRRRRCVPRVSGGRRYVHGALLPVDGGWLAR